MGFVATSRAHNKVVILDSCFSGDIANKTEMPNFSVNKRLDDNDKKFCKKVTIFIVAVIFGVVGVLWIIGYRYYTVFIESGIILAELLQLVAICHNMIFNENDYKLSM
jgi:hypothetical protein